MKYRSKKGTVIDIPDGLTDKQIAAIKADADAGYGTRAQATATSLGKSLTTAKPKPATAQPRPSDQDLFSGVQPDGTRPAVIPSPAAQAPDAAVPVPATSPGASAAANGATGQPALAPIDGFDTASYLKANPDVARYIEEAHTKGDTRTTDQIAQDHYRENSWRSGAFGPGVENQIPKTSGNFNPDGTVSDKAGPGLAETEDERVRRQFALDNPDQTDQYGNTVTFTMGPDGKPVRHVTQGAQAKAFSDAAAAGLTSFDPEADRKGATNASYSTITKYYDRDKAREEEDAKQELAQRGIPYDPAAAQDPNTKNLYGRTVGAIDQKYRGLKDDASNQSILAGNQAYATTSAARDSYLHATTEGATAYGADFGKYQNTIQSQLGDNAKFLLNLSAQQIATIKGISVQEAQNLKDNALKEQSLAETKRSNLVSEDISKTQLTDQEADIAVDNEIKRRGLDQAAADALRSNATEILKIKESARQAKAADATNRLAINTKGSGGGGASSGGSSGSGGGDFVVLDS